MLYPVLGYPVPQTAKHRDASKRAQEVGITGEVRCDGGEPNPERRERGTQHRWGEALSEGEVTFSALARQPTS